MPTSANHASVNDKAVIWIVDDDESLRWVLQKTLSSAGFDTACFEDAYHALETLAEARPKQTVSSAEQAIPDVILSDIRMPGMDGLAFLNDVHKKHPDLPIIIMTAHSDLDSAVKSYKTGAFDYLPKPFDIDEAVTMVNRALSSLLPAPEPSAQNKTTSDAEVSTDQKTLIIGESAAMQEVFRAIGRLAHSNITVLINGESGTGKELIAKALHEHSPRKKNAFIALNMAAIPNNLIEAELFGHEKGAFTGASSLRKGRFEQANGGTLFLDEIGDMPFDTQTRLLRVLADGEFYRVGGHTPVNVDVRIIAATHQNLEERVAEGVFREDLFYRLNVIRLQLPALRERTEDLPMLADFFLQKSAKELDEEPKQLNAEALKCMQAFDWRGNVRQLENICRWLMVMAAGKEIGKNDLPDEIRQYNPQSTPRQNTQDSHVTNTASDIHTNVTSPQVMSATPQNTAQPSSLHWLDSLAQHIDSEIQSGNSNILGTVMPEFERTLIRTALKHTKGRKGEAAELLGWGRNTLTRKLRELNIQYH